MEDRLLEFKFKSEDYEGRGDCFYLLIGHGNGKTAPELRQGVANQTRSDDSKIIAIRQGYEENMSRPRVSE